KDGVETMRLVLEEKFDIGITQVSEILQASPEAVAGPFPKDFELATTYAMWHRNNITPAAKAFAPLLPSPPTRMKLEANGIRPARRRSPFKQLRGYIRVLAPDLQQRCQRAPYEQCCPTDLKPIR